MASTSRHGFTEAEYLALEAASETKHEFVNGAIVAMAGAQPPHNALVVKIAAALLALTRGKGCLVLSSDQRVHVSASRIRTSLSHVASGATTAIIHRVS